MRSWWRVCRAGPRWETQGHCQVGISQSSESMSMGPPPGRSATPALSFHRPPHRVPMPADRCSVPMPVSPDLPVTGPTGQNASGSAPRVKPARAASDIGDPDGPASTSTGPDAARAAAWVFALLVVVGLGYIQLRVPGSRWFAGDDWLLLTDGTRLSFSTLTADINGHWVLIPRAVFTALWWLVGLDDFWPYKLVAVFGHGAVVVLLRAVMRRAGVRPWTATLVASTFLVLGAGGENIVYPLQVALTGALACGLAHLLLADQVVASPRRDVAGLAVGATGLMFSGLALPMTLAVGVVVLLRRGWRAAMFHTLPIAVGYLAWASSVDANRITAAPPSLATVLSFVTEGQQALLTALGGGHAILALLFGMVLLGAGALALLPVLRLADGRVSGLVDLVRIHAVPLALWCAALFFNALLARNIYYLGPSAVWAIRYVYIGAALGLPMLAVAGDALARRVPSAGVAFIVLALLPVPSNVHLLQNMSFSPFDPVDDARVVRLAVRVPFAHDVDPAVRPIPDKAHLGVTIGYLLGAAGQGRLDPGTSPLTPADIGEMRVRLGFAGGPVAKVPPHCRPLVLPTTLRPEVGNRFVIGGPVVVVSHEAGGEPGRKVLRGDFALELVKVQLPGMELEVSGTGPLCELR